VGVIGLYAGKGGKYLLIPPGNKDKASEGYIVAPMEGYRETMVFRPVVVGKGTMEGSIALAHQTRTYALADATNPKPTNVLDGWDKAWHSLPVDDIGWFEYLAKFVNNEPIRERDKVMIGMLSSLGIEKGKPFKPDLTITRVLNAAIKDAYAVMQRGYVTLGKVIAAWWPDRQWMNINPALVAKMGEAWSFTTTDAVYSYERAIAPFFWANYLPPKLGSEQLYLMGIRDKSGALLSGASNYRLRVPADVPAPRSGWLYRGHGKSPVVDIAYDDALAYAKWLGRSLPTKAQWEFAARGGHDGEVDGSSAFDPKGKSIANTWQGIFPVLTAGFFSRKRGTYSGRPR
jgi:hypothetical protein